jgi:hypothetical protein
MTAAGFTPDEKLMLLRWPLDTPVETVLGGISVDAKGAVVCGGAEPARSGITPSAPTLTRVALRDAGLGQATGQAGGLSAPAPNAGPTPGRPAPPPDCEATMQPHEPLEIQATVAAGEAVRVALVSTDHKRGAAASTIPFPLANADKGCRLQVILGMKDAALVLIEGTGFPANTALTFDATTGTSTRPLHPQSNAGGRIVVPLLVSAAKGQTSGETTVRFAGINRQPTLDTSKEAATPDPGCAPAVSYRWGAGSYRAE